MEVFTKITGQYEAELVARIQSGDERAEEELFRRYHRGVTIIINHAWRNCPMTADICQETFRSALQKIREGAIREPEKLPAYLWGIAHHLVIEFLRKASPANHTNIEDAEDLPDSAPTQLDSLLQKESARLVYQLLEQLRSERDREVLYRFYIAEDDKADICADLGLTSDQFNVVLFRARKQYKKLYEKVAAKVYR